MYWVISIPTKSSTTQKESLTQSPSPLNDNFFNIEDTLTTEEKDKQQESYSREIIPKIKPFCEFVGLFKIKEMKIGSLDTLINLSDDLLKLDLYGESVTRKIAQEVIRVVQTKSEMEEEILGQQKKAKSRMDKHYNKKKQNPEDSLKIGDKLISEYLKNWNWDEQTFSREEKIKITTKIIQKRIGEIEDGLTEIQHQYIQSSSTLKGFEKRASGNLMICDLDPIANGIKRIQSLDDWKSLKQNEPFCIHTSNITTLFVVFKKYSERDFLERYETICENIIPRSARKIQEDKENYLYTVCLFETMKDTFRTEAQKHSFISREVNWDDLKTVNFDEEFQKLKNEANEKFNDLHDWCIDNFGECFKNWIHLKAARILLESVLRFGRPINFTVLIIKPKEKMIKKLRVQLDSLFGEYLDTSKMKPSKDEKTPFLIGMNEEIFPYVEIKINAIFN
ncbi:v-type proton atpase subunit c [Anaeramoeba ignava]|uniref:V-type proton ATPase subunit C n=1 Tax=Anaeramoeba ignava TaxID=1746090 RepID=A0A9Q0LKJ9_ANAIG|nr:v-type proton atpase subunit c [Anaeramoeba ignava]|eukprot:Anaeramoba_ignava/a481253_57.p1 GENE.a481253_57~~a481253_57.p1  ORF type:complete len:450 (-),score=160.06 a481253_57:139-1488(-)